MRTLIVCKTCINLNISTISLSMRTNVFTFNFSSTKILLNIDVIDVSSIVTIKEIKKLSQHQLFAHHTNESTISALSRNIEGSQIIFASSRSHHQNYKIWLRIRPFRAVAFQKGSYKAPRRSGEKEQPLIGSRAAPLCFAFHPKAGQPFIANSEPRRAAPLNRTDERSA